jgi:protein tyrosine/serine phosphatase
LFGARRLAPAWAAAAVLGAVAAISAGYGRSAPPAAPPAAPPTTGRNPRWAQPVALPGCPNLHKVADGLYRSAQPEPEGFRELKKLGVKTVVNLRAFHSDADEVKESGVEGLIGERISFKTWHAEDEDVVKFLKIVADPAKAPVLVHCQHGADRTGLMCAIYRVAVQGWTKADALEEMTQGGYGFHTVWKNLPEYFEKLDVEKIRRQAGIAAPAGSSR